MYSFIGKNTVQFRKLFVLNKNILCYLLLNVLLLNIIVVSFFFDQIKINILNYFLAMDTVRRLYMVSYTMKLNISFIVGTYIPKPYKRLYLLIHNSGEFIAYRGNARIHKILRERKHLAGINK